jgi:hypoxanthine phosphoribosyltransferase
MKTVKMSWQEFDRVANNLAVQIKKSRIKFSAICGIPRGGLILAVRLSHLLKIPLTEMKGLSFKDKTVLIVDDVADTGETIELFASCGFITATLFWNPKSSVKPKFWAKRKSKEWILFPWEADEECLNSKLNSGN